MVIDFPRSFCSTYFLYPFCTVKLCEKHSVAVVTCIPPCGPRYKHVRKHKSFGKMVYKHLSDVKMNLLLDHPKRNPMLKVIKEIGLYILSQKTVKATEEPES